MWADIAIDICPVPHYNSNVFMPVCPPVSFGPGGFFIGVDMEEKTYKTYRQLLTKLRSRVQISVERCTDSEMIGALISHDRCM